MTAVFGVFLVLMKMEVAERTNFSVGPAAALKSKWSTYEPPVLGALGLFLDHSTSLQTSRVSNYTCTVQQSVNDGSARAAITDP